MSKKSPTQIRKETRKPITDKVLEFIKKEFDDDAARIKDDEIMCPWLDTEGNEIYFTVKVSIPLGEGHGKIPFDGYSEAENYKMENERKEEERKEREKKKAEKIARDEARRKAEAEMREKRRKEKEGEG